MKNLFLLILAVIAFYSCKNSNNELPILGERDFNGKDSVYHQIADFSFVNENGDTVNQNITKGKNYVADFFFTSCPTICPIMSAQLLRVHEKFDKDPNFLIVSHTIDPVHDTPEVLAEYKKKLGVNDNNWIFLTGDQDEIMNLAQNSYLVSAQKDPLDLSNGGFVHSGALVLVDKSGRVRGFYDGTKPEEVDRLMADIPKLQNEKN